MDDDELAAFLADEAEAGKDAPLPDEAVGTRPNYNRSVVFSLRLRADEVAAVEAAAERAGLPTSTLVRSWVLQRLQGAGPAETALRAMIHGEVRAAVREVVQETRAS